MEALYNFYWEKGANKTKNQQANRKKKKTPSFKLNQKSNNIWDVHEILQW